MCLSDVLSSVYICDRQREHPRVTVNGILFECCFWIFSNRCCAGGLLPFDGSFSWACLIGLVVRKAIENRSINSLCVFVKLIAWKLSCFPWLSIYDWIGNEYRRRSNPIGRGQQCLNWPEIDGVLSDKNEILDVCSPARHHKNRPRGNARATKFIVPISREILFSFDRMLPFCDSTIVHFPFIYRTQLIFFWFRARTPKKCHMMHNNSNEIRWTTRKRVKLFWASFLSTSCNFRKRQSIFVIPFCVSDERVCVCVNWIPIPMVCEPLHCTGRVRKNLNNNNNWR